MRSYGELLKQYNILLCENKELKVQINKLRKRLGISAENEKKQAFVMPGVTINRSSSTSEEFSVYRLLFRGCEDVFARRWYSKTTEKKRISAYL